MFNSNSHLKNLQNKPEDTFKHDSMSHQFHSNYENNNFVDNTSNLQRITNT
jgi:hypothetical protein